MTREELIHEWKNKALIMSDVDNCIIDENGKIAKETKDALTSLINVNGHAFYFGMMSYRPVLQVFGIYNSMELRKSSYLIGNRGAEVLSMSSDQFMINLNIGALSAKRIYEELLKIGEHNKEMSFYVTYDGVWSYLYNITKEQWGEYNIVKNLVLHDEFEAVCVIGFSISNLGKDQKDFIDFAETINDVKVIIDGSNVVLVNKDVSLLNAFDYIIKRLAVANSHVAVISKSIKDKALFMVPEVYGITSKDADEELKQVAKLVIDKEPKDFIPEAIKCFKEYLKTVEIK